MSDMRDAILDATEARIRRAGYNGFSFREIATDVGVKSSSVHYYFPTKEVLAAAVARRYRERFLSVVRDEIDQGKDATHAWTQGFRRALHGDGRMCLCGVLGAAASTLPAEVLTEARGFFEASLDNLAEQGLTRVRATQVLAMLEGALLLANVLAQPQAFEDAVATLG